MRKVFFAILLTITSHISNAQPNVVFIIGDDISADDIGCFGNKYISTPNIDKLAAKGIKFTNTYLTISSCSPSRGSILTGRYPHNTGGPELHANYAENQVLLPKLLKDAGYYTAQAGKWHLGRLGAPHGLALSAFDKVDSTNQKQFPSGAELWVTRLKERPRDKPFFMWFASHDAHNPWTDTVFTKKYSPDKIKVPKLLADTKAIRKDLAGYYGEISLLDYYVGEVVKELEAQNILDNTIIVFIADNGRGFNGYKTQLTTGGIKTPLIMAWAGHIKEGLTSNSLVSAIDIAPTLLQSCAVKAIPAIQGKSFYSLFEQPDKHFRNYVFAEHNWHAFTAYERMISDGRYLYIENGLPHLKDNFASDINTKVDGATTAKVGGKVIHKPVASLFDLSSDPECLKDIILDKSYSKHINRLAKTLQTWKNQTGDYMPKNLTNDMLPRKFGTEKIENEKRGEMPGARTGAASINHSGPF